MNYFAHAGKAFGLEINLKKAVVMHNPMPEMPFIESAIYIEGKKLDLAHSFVYIGSSLCKGCNFDNEISMHIEKAPGSFSGLEKYVWS